MDVRPPPSNNDWRGGVKENLAFFISFCGGGGKELGGNFLFFSPFVLQEEEEN